MAKGEATHRGGKKGRKIDRNRKWCEAYRRRGQREINRALRWIRWLRRDARARDLAGRPPAPHTTSAIERALAAVDPHYVKTAQRLAGRHIP